MENNYINLEPNQHGEPSESVEGHLKMQINDLENRRFKSRQDYLHMVELKERLNKVSSKKVEIIEEYKKQERLREEKSVKASKIFEIYCSKELDTLTKSRQEKTKKITQKTEFLGNQEKESNQENRMHTIKAVLVATLG